jgi:hypothetical protein
VQFPVLIKLRRSLLLAALLFCMHAAAAASVLSLPVLPASALLALIVFSLWWTLRPARIVGLRLTGANTVDGLLVDGRRVALTVLPESTVFYRMIVLRLRLDEETRTSALVLLADQMPAEHFRQLRLYLRWRSAPNERAGSIS